MRVPVSKSAKRDWEHALRAIDEGSRLQERKARLGARTACDRREGGAPTEAPLKKETPRGRGVS